MHKLIRFSAPGGRLARAPLSRASLTRVWRPLSRAASTPSTPAPATAAVGQPSSGGEDSTNAQSESKDKKGPMSWSRFLLYVAGGISSVTFLYYFHKAKYSLHQTEILLLAAFRRLPLYWPPTPPELESEIDSGSLPMELVVAFAEWFIWLDLQEPEGVCRDDVLELLGELGFDEEEKPCKEFLVKGDHHLEERRRLAGAGLQESISLLAKLSREPGADDGAEPTRLGKDAVDILKRKRAGVASVMGGATALQQAQKIQAALSSDAAPVFSPSQPEMPFGDTGARLLLGDTGATEEEGDTEGDLLSEAQQRLLEATRLSRIEEGLLARRERLGSLSLAEEARLAEVQEKRDLLKH